MKTLKEVLDLACSHFESKGLLQPRREAEELLSLALKTPRMDLYMDFSRPLQEEELSLCRELMRRRLTREPIQYMAGAVDFFGVRIAVDQRVLIPRPETEILADRVARHLAELDLQGKTLLDLCCGSACLAISLKKRLPDLEVIASDLSPEALQLARQNAEQNGVEVKFLEGDLLAPLGERKVDVVLCNPPYIRKSDWAKLEPEVCVFEPKMALVGGEDGLDYYRRLAAELPPYLNPGAELYCELGAGQGRAVREIFKQACDREGEVAPDWSGHDRFFFLEFL